MDCSFSCFFSSIVCSNLYSKYNITIISSSKNSQGIGILPAFYHLPANMSSLTYCTCIHCRYKAHILISLRHFSKTKAFVSFGFFANSNYHRHLCDTSNKAGPFFLQPLRPGFEPKTFPLGDENPTDVSVFCPSTKAMSWN